MKAALDEPLIVRVLPEDLEPVLASLKRTEERTKEWMRAHFVEGRSIGDIARESEVASERVANSVRAIRAKLAEQASPMQYVQATLTLPLVLCQELQALANELGAHGSRELAETTLKPVLRAVTTARKSLR